MEHSNLRRKQPPSRIQSSSGCLLKHYEKKNTDESATDPERQTRAEKRAEQSTAAGKLECLKTPTEPLHQ